MYMYIKYIYTPKLLTNKKAIKLMLQPLVNIETVQSENAQMGYCITQHFTRVPTVSKIKNNH